MKLARAIWLGPTLFIVGACQESPTALHVYVTFPGTATAQLEFAVLNEDRAIIVPPTLRPQAPGPALSSPQDVVVYLPDVFQTVICQVRTVDPPGPTGEASVMIAPHRFSRAFIDLLPAPGDDGGVPPVDAAPDGAPDGGIVDAPAMDVPASNLENGQPCSDGRACASGYCADDVCCNSSCVGACRSCNLSDTVGACTAVAVGQPATANECPMEAPSTCGTNGLCDGQGACQKHKCDAL